MIQMERLTVQNAIQRYGPAYIKTRGRNLPPHVKKAITDSAKCRTEEMGGRMQICPKCGFKVYALNSCGNRHCPTCQNLAKKRWVEEQKDRKILNVPYFHVILTVPHELNHYFLSKDQEKLYNLLLKSAADSVMALCQDKERLGNAVPGMISVLHTWGQNLSCHPHVHMLVTGGGLTKDNKWISVKNKNFLVKVDLLSALFRGKFMHGFRNLISGVDQALVNTLYEKNWVTFIKPLSGDPKNSQIQIANALDDMHDHTYTMDIESIEFTSEVNKEMNEFNIPKSATKSDLTEEVLGYFANSIYQPVIDNRRILDISDQGVRFSYIDYAHNGQKTYMTLTGEEFIRRFALHVLPVGFKRVRYYGIYFGRGLKERMKLCKQLTNTPETPWDRAKKLSPAQIFNKNFGECPRCGTSMLDAEYKNEWLLDLVFDAIHGGRQYLSAVLNNAQRHFFQQYYKMAKHILTKRTISATPNRGAP